jgi:hypothetical protein
MSRSRAAAMTVAVFLALLQGCTPAPRAQQEPSREGGPPTFVDSGTAARNALATFRNLVTPDNYQELGFASLDEVGSAQLGAPLPVSMVELDELREYQAGRDPSMLLTSLHQDYYPVQVEEQTRASILIERMDEGWAAVSFGNAGLAERVATMRTRIAATAEGEPSEFAIVQVPALGIYFLGHRDRQGELQLTPLTDHPTFELRAGQTLPAREVFASLVPAARNYNELPM